MEIIGHVLDQLGLHNYRSKFEEQICDDNVMDLVLENELYMDMLKEIVPAMGHRLLIVNEFRKARQATSSKVKCTICKKIIEPSFSEIWSHLKVFHYVTKCSPVFKCPICSSEFTWYSSFWRHFTLQHSTYDTDIEPNCQSDNAVGNLIDLEKLSEVNHSPDIEAGRLIQGLENQTQVDHSMGNGVEKLIQDLEEETAKFLVKIQSSGRIPLAFCKELIQMTNRVIMSILDIVEHLQAKQISINKYIKLLRNPFANVSTQYKLEKYLSKKNLLITPEEIVLSSYFKNTFKNNSTCTKLVYDVAQFVPISRVLKMVLESPGVLESLDYSITNSVHGQKMFQSAVHGQYFEKRLRECDPNIPSVFILFYFDEVEICNPLGSRAGLHKLGNCYFTILNIKGSFNSKLENIFTFLTFKSQWIKKYGLNRIFEPVIQDIISLKQDPLIVVTPNYTGPVNVELGQVIGDNLGIHMLFGFTESFSANYPCRFCKMPRLACQNTGKPNKSLSRTQLNYNQDLLKNNLSETGIKGESIFNAIPYFHITNNYCPDIMHDIFEGVAPLDIKVLLNNLLSKKILAIDEINSRILSFNYGNHNPDKPSPLLLKKLTSSESTIGQSASQTICLIRNFGFLFGDKFSPGSPHWVLYLLLREILDIIMAPCVSELSLSYLDSLIEDHHHLYVQLTGSNLRPKHHHMLHYSDAIRKVGPLLQYWVMRYEARHKFFKNVSNICGNYKNILKTMISRNQLFLAYKFLLNEEYKPDGISEVKYLPDLGKDSNLFLFLQAQLELTEGTPVCLIKSIVYRGSKLQAGDILLKSYHAEMAPNLIRVSNLVQIDQNIHIVYVKLTTEYFDTFYHAFKVLDSELCSLEDRICKIMDVESDNSTVSSLENLGSISESQGDGILTQPEFPGEQFALVPISSSDNRTVYVLSGDHVQQKGSRNRKRKAFFDEENMALDVQKILIEQDNALKQSYGSQIIHEARNQRPLKKNLRSHLVRTMCGFIMRKSNTNYPSTDERLSLANAIVSQLYSALTGVAKAELTNSYFTGSGTFEGSDGKVKSRSPTGYIQNYFKNYWTSLRKHDGRQVEGTILSNQDDIGSELNDTVDPEEINNMKEWLKNNRGPPQKIFDYMNKTASARRLDILKCREKDLSSVLQNWPRLFDTQGAIPNDFSLAYPLVSDNLFTKWPSLAPKLLQYFTTLKKSPANLGIFVNVEDKKELTAFFIIGYLIRSRVKKLSQINTMKTFIDVVECQTDVNVLAANSENGHPKIFCKGDKGQLLLEEFYVVFEKKSLKVDTLAAAVDLAYKIFYVFNCNFPQDCFGSWQFLDYVVFDMIQKVPVSPTISEIASFVSADL